MVVRVNRGYWGPIVWGDKGAPRKMLYQIKYLM